jgi:hypothetical protein
MYTTWFFSLSTRTPNTAAESCTDMARLVLKITLLWASGVAQVVEHLPSMREVLSSKPQCGGKKNIK